MGWTADDMPAQSGGRYIITGANSGLGFEASRLLAEQGAAVVMACRSLDRGNDAVAEIRESDPEADVTVEELDLASLDSIESFTDRMANGGEPIDVLMNNAGVMAIPRKETEDGFEMQIGVNHLGHFALTGRLLESLADDGRVITVSSGLHERGEIDFEDLHGEQSYDKWDAYAQSKLANLLFAFELNRHFESADDDRLSVGVHPGYADTNLQRRGPELAGSRVRLAMMRIANFLFAQPPEQGAWPMLYAATASDVEGGAYYGPGGLMNMRGSPAEQEPTTDARDPETAAKLWEVSEELTGVRPAVEAEN
jgi:NAD(P)-dependent dehydrogenase (short-subunit alcohol dehydrogenase family)